MRGLSKEARLAIPFDKDDRSRRLAAVANRDRERRKWVGRRALLLGAVSALCGRSHCAAFDGPRHSYRPKRLREGGVVSLP